MKYTLFNKTNSRYLEFPVGSIWQTDDYKVAEEMLNSCKTYMRKLGLSNDEISQTVIIELPVY